MMGREIRRVPPHWEHPVWTAEEIKEAGVSAQLIGQPRACHDKTYDAAAAEWLADLAAWPSVPESERGGCRYAWDYYGPPPKAEWYRPAFTAEPTWWQVYETVSEGTPCTPAFATREELIEHLVHVGSGKYDGKWSRAQAEKFVSEDGGWLPSAIMIPGEGMITGPALADHMAKRS